MCQNAPLPNFNDWNREPFFVSGPADCARLNLSLAGLLFGGPRAAPPLPYRRALPRVKTCKLTPIAPQEQASFDTSKMVSTMLSEIVPFPPPRGRELVIGPSAILRRFRETGQPLSPVTEEMP